MSIQSVAAACRNELERLDAMTDNPTKRAREAAKLIEYLREFTSRAAEQRRIAYRELHDLYGWSAGMLAEEYGISRARAQQIIG